MTTNTAANTTFAGRIVDTGGMTSLVKTGTGSLTLTGASNYTGTTSINQGTLVITSIAISNSASSLGNPSASSSTINMGNAGPATLQFVGTNNATSTTRVINLQGPATLDASEGANSSGNDFVLQGSPNAIVGTNANLTLAGSSVTVGISSGNPSYGGKIGTPMSLGTGSVTKTGPGTWTLDLANTYTGGTNVNAGLLMVANSGGLGTGPVNVSGGTLDATINGLSLSNTLAVGPQGTLNLQIGKLVTTPSAASFGGTLDLFGVTSSTGTKDLINYTSETGTFSNVNGLLSPTYTLSYTGNQLDLVYATTATTYTLVATAGSLNMRVGTSNTITAAITNTGTGLADTLNYTGLSLSPSAALTGFTPQSGGPLALGGGSATSGTFTAATAGSYSFTPSVASATNATIGNTAGAPVQQSATPVTVGAYDYAQPSYTAGAVAFGNVRVGATATGSLAISNTTVTNPSYQDNLNVAATTNNAAVTATGFTGEGAGTAVQNVVFTASTGTAGSLSGAVTLSLTSAPIASGLNPQITTDTTSITTTGGVYRYSSGSLDSATTNLNLGTVHASLGTSASYSVNAVNTAINDGYSDQLAVSLGSFLGLDTGSLVTTGATTAVSTGAGSRPAATINLSTASAGFINGSYNGTLISSPTASGLDTGRPVGTGVVNVTGQVYSGQMVYTGNGGLNTSWGTAASNGSNWKDSQAAAVQAAPGLDPNFTATDSATFDATTTGGTITLDNASPSLAAITFSNSNANYAIAQGLGGTLTLNGSNNSSRMATVAISGTQTISASDPLEHERLVRSGRQRPVDPVGQHRRQRQQHGPRGGRFRRAASGQPDPQRHEQQLHGRDVCRVGHAVRH